MILKINKENKFKIIIVAGPTASGKSSLALDLAKKYNGIIINADSQQIYKEVNKYINRAGRRRPPQEGACAKLIELSRAESPFHFDRDPDDHKSDHPYYNI